jgi:hypothetical protein
MTLWRGCVGSEKISRNALMVREGASTFFRNESSQDGRWLLDKPRRPAAESVDIVLIVWRLIQRRVWMNAVIILKLTEITFKSNNRSEANNKFVCQCSLANQHRCIHLRVWGYWWWLGCAWVTSQGWTCFWWWLHCRAVEWHARRFLRDTLSS